jgi:hypothetical protein
MLGWDGYEFYKKRAGKPYAELVFLHPVGFVGNVKHFGASGPWIGPWISTHYVSCLGWPGAVYIKSMPGHVMPDLCFCVRWNDVDIKTSDIFTPTHNQISGLNTRARASQLNNQVSSFLACYSSYLHNGNMCCVLLLRNDGQERNGVAFAPVTFGFRNSSSL